MSRDFEFKQLLRAYRSGIISQATFEGEMTCLEAGMPTAGNGNGSSGGFKAFGRTYKSERDAVVSFLDKVRAGEAGAARHSLRGPKFARPIVSAPESGSLPNARPI